MQWQIARLAGAVLGLGLVIQACGGGDADDQVDVVPAAATASVEGIRIDRTGGMGSAFDSSERAYSLTARNINHYERQVFADGKAVFEEPWNPRPDGDFGGLGPNFDADSCSACHLEDGRAAGPSGDGVLPLGMTVMLSTSAPGTINHYGAVLSSNRFGGVPEAAIRVAYEEVAGTFDDGEPFSLRRPVYSVDIGDGPALPGDAVISPRVAPQIPGLGLLELIPDDQLAALADPDDLDGDGVSGRLSAATDLLTDTPVIGRFGWQASHPTVEQQTATALFNDMGLTSRYFPSPGCDRWSPCVRAGEPLSTEYNVEDYGNPTFGVQEPSGGEVTDAQLLDLSIYSQTLAVPTARDLDDPVVTQGFELFETSGCASCHAGGFTPRRGPIQGLSNQLIQPYTDLLLHDVGLDLGDQTLYGTPVLTEWRTPPLWGLGLLETVSGHTTLLHDGRARDFSEAILWHDGEAAASAAAYRAMSAAERTALISFLESL